MFQHRRHAVVCASHQEVTQGEVPMLRSNELQIRCVQKNE